MGDGDQEDAEEADQADLAEVVVDADETGVAENEIDEGEGPGEVEEDVDDVDEGDIEIRKICDGILALMYKNLIPVAGTGGSTMFCYVMKNELILDWLNFVKGVVDSEDVSLNISSETLRQNKILRVIKKRLVKKCLEMFAERAEKNDDVKEFFEQFDKCVKFGLHEDSTVRAKIAELLRLNVSTSNDEQLSLKVQKTAEVPQAQFIDKLADVPVDMPRQVPAVQVVQKTAEIPQIPLIEWWTLQSCNRGRYHRYRQS